LRKRENFRQAFDNFDPVKIAGYGSQKVASLLADEGIIRNRLKVSATISNAQAFLAIQQEHGRFSTFLWDFVGGKPIHNNHHQLSEIPAHTDLSSAMSKALKQKGFKFVGTTVIYAFMQATGMVNDHVLDCYRFAELNPNI
jgi:DNA-3-methyladenine glycosylase I